MKGTSIKGRLMRVILITCGATLLLTCLAYFGYEYINFRGLYLKQLSNTGKIIAANSTAALAFQDAEAANEILASLKVDPNIIGACIYDEHGKLFAKYPITASDSIYPAPPSADGYDMAATHFEGYQPIMQKDKRLGTLYLKTDMRAMYELFGFYSLIALLVLGVAFLFAYVLSNSMQKSISRPIMSLAETSRAISDQRDYSVRAVKYTDDELGLLTDAFNQMLSEIEQQNLEIVSFNQRLEEKVSERTAQLEAANKELESFSYSVSHDLRSPLRAVIGYSKILEEESGMGRNPDSAVLLRNIQNNAARMGALIDDLLSFSRLGRKEVRKTPLDMNNAVQDALREINQVPTHHAGIVVHPLPQAVGDRALLHQVWLNLIGNAIKYSAKKDNPQIEVGSLTQQGKSVYYVKDNGAGFNMEYANKLFNVFQRLHGPDEFEGTGIGLAIVSRIINKHGGKIWAEGKVDEGATFYFTLPNE